MRSSSNIRRGLLAALTATLAVALTACGGSTSADSGSGGGDIVIGATLPLTGSAASYGAIMRNGMEMAISQINKEGGVNGRNLRGEYLDSQGNPGVSVGLTRQLITNGAVAITTCFPAVALAQQSITSRASVPLLAPCFNENAQLGQKGLYNFTPTTDQERAAMLSYLAKERGFKHVGILAESVTSDASQQALVDTWKDLTGSPASLQTIETGASDATPQLNKLMDGKPDALFVLANGTLGNTVVSNLQAMGVKIPIFGNVAATGYVDAIRAAGLDWSWTNAVSNYDKSFTDAFHATVTDRAPQVWDGTFYTAVHVVAEGLKYADKHGHSMDAKGLFQALQDNRTWSGGCCGDLKFLNNNGVDGTFAIFSTTAGAAPAQVATVKAPPVK
jgi:branched-chain amino acid transport system substrate-binding protein